MKPMAMTLVIALTVLLAACDATPSMVVMASTTSTEDSGLLEVLVPAFEEAHPDYNLRYTAVGSGQALELGRRGDVDVLLVHAPAAESAFVAAGDGVIRCRVMFNDYVLLGPPDDPAGVAEVPGVAGAAPATGLGEGPEARSDSSRQNRSDISVALRRIAASRAPFASRGDDSGTHRRERRLWDEAGGEPAGEWYLEVGQGMAQTLQFASERQAYTLSDRSTYVTMRDALDLQILVEGDPRLKNQYSVIPVTGASNAEGAAAFTRWVSRRHAQELIGAFGSDILGKPLFTPNGNGCDY